MAISKGAHMKSALCLPRPKLYVLPAAVVADEKAQSAA